MERHSLLNVFITFWLISVIIVSCAEIKKRDVRHRIILKSSRKPRNNSHKNRNHHHNHHHGHDHHDHDHDYNYNHGHNHHYHDSYEHDHSFEDDNKSYSPESSFENTSKYSHKGHHDHDYTRNNKPSQHIRNSEYDDAKFPSFRDNWTPLLSPENKVLRHSQERNRKRRKPYHSNESKNHHSPLQIDITTSYPQKLPYPSLFDTNDFLASSSSVIGNSYNFNQKTIDSNQSPLIKAVKIIGNHPNKRSNPSINKNNKESNNYEVRENLKDDFIIDEAITFRPSLNDKNNPAALAEASEIKETVVNKEENIANVENNNNNNESNNNRTVRKGRGRRLNAKN